MDVRSRLTSKLADGDGGRDAMAGHQDAEAGGQGPQPPPQEHADEEELKDIEVRVCLIEEVMWW